MALHWWQRTAYAFTIAPQPPHLFLPSPPISPPATAPITNGNKTRQTTNRFLEGRTGPLAIKDDEGCYHEKKTLTYSCRAVADHDRSLVSYSPGKKRRHWRQARRVAVGLPGPPLETNVVMANAAAGSLGR